jgi:nitrogen-specific signal transduction histidine kinase/CheY-like chemotaxis protein
VTDITDRVHAQAETEELQTALQRAQRMDSLGQLAGGVAHDFNNLLAVILNYADFVAETLGDGHPAAADVAEISRATERAAELTRQLLVFSRHDHLRLELVDVNEVARATQQLLARTLGEDVELNVLEAEQPVPALADAGQLQQVLMNLVLNARDALPHGGRVTMSVCEVVLTGAEAGRRGVRPGRHVRVDVTDDGEGMAPDVAERAFEPFFTTKPKGRGTGLGLSTVYGIVTNAEGHIEIRSRIKEGTTVTMHLPITDASAAEEATTEVDAPGGATILVVEDEDAIRTLTHRILSREGYRVLEAPAPAAALELLEQAGTVDLLLTDVVMPGMSGKALSDRLRELQPGLRVLFMSGYTDNVMDRYGLDEAGDMLVHKPFNAQQLLCAVQDLLS